MNGWITKPTFTFSLLVALSCSASADVELGVKVKKAMLDGGPVPVIVFWRHGAIPARELMGSSGLLELAPLNATAASVPAKQLEALAKSEAVQNIIADQEIVLDEPTDIPKGQSTADFEEKNKMTWGLDAVGAKAVWEQLGVTGKGVKVGIVDTGLDGLHPEFRERIKGWGDFTSHRKPTAEDIGGHGTHVAGTIVGRTHQDGLRFGVAPDAQLVIGRAIGPGGGRRSQVMAALLWVADPDGNPDTDDGARVINCSFGHEKGEWSEEAAWHNLFAHLTNLGVTLVVSAGNSGREGPDSVGSPGFIDFSLTVGAVGPDLKRASFSSYSLPKTGNAKPDIAAPGVDVLSYYVNNTSDRLNGTSMAAPHVTGVVALMLEANPTLTPQQIREIVEGTAKDLGEPGKDNEYGAGLIDAVACVKKAKALKDQPEAAKTIDQLITEGQRFMVGNSLNLAVKRFMTVIHGERAQGEKAYEAMYYLSESLARMNSFRGAVNGFRKIIELAPTSPFAAKARFQIGKAYMNAPSKSTSEAIETYKRAIKAFGEFYEAHPEHEWVPLAMLEAASALATLQQFDAAAALIKELMTKFPNHPSTSGAAELIAKIQATAGKDPLGD